MGPADSLRAFAERLRNEPAIPRPNLCYGGDALLRRAMATDTPLEGAEGSFMIYSGKVWREYHEWLEKREAANA